MSSINGNFSLNNINVVKPYDDKKEIIFLQEDDIQLEFKNNELELNFNLYKNTGFDFKNNVFKGINQKITLYLNLFYMWINADYPPRLNLNVMKNDLIYISRGLGINDTLDVNHISINLVIDIQNNDKLNFILKKDDLEINSIKIYDNSNYILKTF